MFRGAGEDQVSRGRGSGERSHGVPDLELVVVIFTHFSHARVFILTHCVQKTTTDLFIERTVSGGAWLLHAPGKMLEEIAARYAPQDMLRSGGGRVDGAERSRRFSLLHLDEGEDYVGDWQASMRAPEGSLDPYPGAVAAADSNGKLRGRIRLLSSSVLFDPDNIVVPMLKFPLGSVRRLEALGGSADAFELVCARTVAIRPGGRDVDYTVDPDALKLGAWRFDLSHQPAGKVLEPLGQLIAIHQIESTPERRSALETLRVAREDSAVFNRRNLTDPETESVCFEAPAAAICPLVREPGRLALTDRRIYFQPINDVTGGCAARSHSLAGIGAVLRRRCALRQTGLEVFFKARGDAGDADDGTFLGPSVLLELRSESEREACVQAMLGALAATALRRGDGDDKAITGGAVAGSALLEGKIGWLEATTAAWRRGAVSNLDYLLYLNAAAGRGFNDLTQWPVMPWVLRDYRSETLNLDDPAVYRDLARPVGALDEERLATLRERMRQMKLAKMPPYLYGTHYSAPGYVLYWLIRAAPAHHLRLQSGRYDAPDRQFHSIAESWESVLTSSADVKELTPEFFTPPADFLVNVRDLPLGRRTRDGAELGDVVLPTWANGDPTTFLRTHRAALESEHVSRRIHEWIDLVFGYKQNGHEAERADNVFHPLTYEDALLELDAEADPVRRASLEAQMNEFGRAPRRLFAKAHPRRDANAHEKYNQTLLDVSDVSDDTPAPERTMALVGTLLALLEPTVESTLEALCLGGGEGGGAGLDDLDEFEQFGADEATELDVDKLNADDAAVKLPTTTEKTADDDEVDVGDFAEENSVAETPTKRGGLKQLWLSKCHGISVGAVRFTGGGAEPAIASVGRDSVLRVHSLQLGDQLHASTVGSLGKMSLSGLAVTAEFALTPGSKFPATLVGSRDGGVYAYDVDGGVTVRRTDAHDARDGVGAMCAPRREPGKIFTASSAGRIRLWDVASFTGLGNRALTGPSAGAFIAELGELESEDCEWISACCDDGGSLALVGADEGLVAAWDPRRKRASWIAEACPSGREVTGLALMPDGFRVAVACGDGFARILELRKCGEVSDDRDLGVGSLTCVLANGKRGLLCGGRTGSLAAWDPDLAAPAAVRKPFRVRGVEVPSRGVGVSCAAAAPGGGVLAVGWDDGSVGVYAENR